MEKVPKSMGLLIFKKIGHSTKVNVSKFDLWSLNYCLPNFVGKYQKVWSYIAHLRARLKFRINIAIYKVGTKSDTFLVNDSVLKKKNMGTLSFNTVFIIYTRWY